MKTAHFPSLSVSDTPVLCVRDHLENFISVPVRSGPHQKTSQQEPLNDIPAMTIWYSQLGGQMETLGRLRHPRRVTLDSQETKTYLLYKAHVKFCLYLSVLFWDVTIECSQWVQNYLIQADHPSSILSRQNPDLQRWEFVLLSSSRDHNYFARF